MLTRFETKSARVKGSSFHPHRPWILASLHTGTVQLWDYRMGVLLEKFEGHDGPVRGLHFHARQPLFVSGGDDNKIKVWNHRQRRYLYTLHGHLDYIRTTKFHHDHPWIVSASDDQSVRIWNWQSRVCLVVIAGHNHYVMCAEFHPREELLLTASLDQTVRVWNISGLRKNKFRDHLNNTVGVELFGQADAELKHMLEGHERGVNWACFHPNLPLIASGSDDKTIKIWQMNEGKVWEVGACRGHDKNVSCVLFHPKKQLLLSNGEDKSVRVWDLTTRVGTHTFKREEEKFWTLIAHPTLNLFAAGHDTGLIIFKLERERPAYTHHQSDLYYIKSNCLRHFDLTKNKDVVVTRVRPCGNLSTRTLDCNRAEEAFLIWTRPPAIENAFYELHTSETLDPDRGEAAGSSAVKKNSGLGALWIARNRFAVLDKSRQILLVKDLKNALVRRVQIPRCDVLFRAGHGKILLSDQECVRLFDVQLKRCLGEVKITKCRFAIWSKKMKHLALLSKHTVVICTGGMEVVFSKQEHSIVKSGGWDQLHELFIYSTNTHVKYILPNGDHGIIRNLDLVLYIIKVQTTQLICLDRECLIRILPIDNTEFKLKLSLIACDFGEVLRVIKSGRLVGQSIIAYLREKGFPELALHFFRDHKTRFALALECHDLTAALESAGRLNTPAVWTRLSELALLLGDHQLTETCYLRAKSFDKLAFLYLVTGNLDKLAKIGKVRVDLSGRFQNALLLGDREETISVLEQADLGSLARLASATHGLEPDEVDPNARLLRPCPPIWTQTDGKWPRLPIPREDSIQDETAASESQNGWEIEDILEISDEESVSLPSCGAGKLNPADVCDQISLGSFKLASQHLHARLGVVNFEPFHSHFLDLFKSRCCVGSFANLPPTYQYFSVQNDHLSLQLGNCLNLTTTGRFNEAIEGFQRLLLKVLYRKEPNTTTKTCTNYIVGLKMEMQRRNLPKSTREEQKRQCEMAAYLTHCGLDHEHHALALRNAVNACYRLNNYQTAAGFAKRLLEVEPSKELVRHARRVLEMWQTRAYDEHPLTYDAVRPFTVCAASYTPIYRDAREERCPACDVVYLYQYKGRVCNVCRVGEIGYDVKQNAFEVNLNSF